MFHLYKIFTLSLFLLGGTVIWASPSFAQESSPELTIGSRGVVSVLGDFSMTPGQSGQVSGLIDFSDTSFLVQGRYELFRGLRGGVLIGFQFPDSDSDLGVIFFHQINVFLSSRWFRIKVGRSRAQTSLFDFPTLRDDDLLQYTNVLNPFSSGRNTQDHQFANSLEMTGILASRYYFSLHAEHMITNADTLGTTSFLLNSVGASVSYQEIPAFARTKALRYLGAGLNLYFLDKTQQSVLWNILLGAAINIIADPIHLLEVRFQGIYSHGVAGQKLTNLNSSYRLRYLSAAASLRYQWFKSTIPTLQAAVTMGYRRYLEGVDTDSWSLVANFFYRLGYGFDVGIQYQFESNQPSLQTALKFPGTEHQLQLVLVFEFEKVFGMLPNRRSILNVEHRYTPQ